MISQKPQGELERRLAELAEQVSQSNEHVKDKVIPSFFSDNKKNIYKAGLALLVSLAGYGIFKILENQDSGDRQTTVNTPSVTYEIPYSTNNDIANIKDEKEKARQHYQKMLSLYKEMIGIAENAYKEETVRPHIRISASEVGDIPFLYGNSEKVRAKSKDILAYLNQMVPECEIAVILDPENKKYKESLDELKIQKGKYSRYLE